MKKFSSGHNACAGCGQLSAVQSVMRALGKNTIIANATGCLEVTTTAYPQSAWGLPWIHSLFENPAAVATGISAALRRNTKSCVPSKNAKSCVPKVVVMAGDGGTFDIGMGIISGMWERKEDILYICYDTESYSNTGFQASGATPYKATTSTSPAGNQYQKKDMIKIALAHEVPYVAQTTAGYPNDIFNKVKKALSMKGPGYIQILSPCIPGWGIKTDEAVEIGKLANRSNLYPLLEYINGELISGGFNDEKQSEKYKKEYITKQKRFTYRESMA